MAVMSNVMSVYAFVSSTFMFSISWFETIICQKAKKHNAIAYKLPL